MDPRHGPGLLSTLIPCTYARQGAEALVKRQKLVTSLLSERRMPKHGWDDASIENLLQVSRYLAVQHNIAARLCDLSHAVIADLLPCFVPKGLKLHSVTKTHHLCLFQDLAAMDSNNFLGTAGVGEREARTDTPPLNSPCPELSDVLRDSQTLGGQDEPTASVAAGAGGMPPCITTPLSAGPRHRSIW